MSRLTTRPLQSVTIDGAEYPLKTHFRNCLLTAAAVADKELSDWEKADIIISNMYSEPYPQNINEAIEKAFNYIMENRKIQEQDNDYSSIIDFERDGQLIYDAFLLKGINLDKSDMSFWEFMSHLRELPRECMLCRIVYLRLQHKRGKLTQEEKAEIKRIGNDIVLPWLRKEEQTKGW